MQRELGTAVMECLHWKAEGTYPGTQDASHRHRTQGNPVAACWKVWERLSLAALLVTAPNLCHSGPGTEAAVEYCLAIQMDELFTKTLVNLTNKMLQRKGKFKKFKSMILFIVSKYKHSQRKYYLMMHT